MKNSRTITRIAFVSLFLLLLITFGCKLLTSTDDGTFKILGSYPSPNSKHLATLWQGMGGGAAGWCFQRITVNRQDDPFDLAKAGETRDYSFNVSCDSHVSTSWISESDLHISYTIENGSVSAYQNKSSKSDPDVALTYEIKNQKQ